MSKRSKRAKLVRPLKQLQQRSAVPSQVHEHLVNRAEYAKRQMHNGDFAGAISTCEPLLNSLPQRSELRLEVLSLLGLAHGMLKHYQQSYDVFGEAISINPMLPELWYNHGLACHYMARLAETVRDFERAVELSKNDIGEMARKFALQLEEARQELQEAIEAEGTNLTLEEYTEREGSFTQAMGLVKQEKWPEAEVLFRQLTETGGRVPSYWGNLGVCLLMQRRYDEAEEALKQALAIDPDYPIARDNLKKLPRVRRAKIIPEHRLINPSQEDDIKQSLALYEKNEHGEVTSRTVIEKVGHAMTGTWSQRGKQPPRYRLFLNPYQDTRFTTCPSCENKTQLRQFSLLINVNPMHPIVLDKTCRYCDACSLLIVDQKQLEEQLAKNFTKTDPEVVGHDYLVIGTVDRKRWSREKQELASFRQVVEYLHDFEEVVTFE